MECGFESEHFLQMSHCTCDRSFFKYRKCGSNGVAYRNSCTASYLNFNGPLIN